MKIALPQCAIVYSHHQRKNTINSTNISCKKNEIVPLPPPPPANSSTFSPIFSVCSNMHMWIVHGAIYELVCSVLFGHFPYSIIRSLTHSVGPSCFCLFIILASMYYEYFESVISNVQEHGHSNTKHSALHNECASIYA